MFRRRVKQRATVCWVALAAALGGCEDVAAWVPGGRPAQTAAPPASAPSASIPRESFLQAAPLQRAVDAIFAPLAKPIRILSFSVSPTTVVAQVQRSEDRVTVDEYRYTGNGLRGPTRVTLLGKGKLKDNLFLLRAVDLSQTAALLARVQGEYPMPIRRLVLKRNLPQSMDIYFRVHVADGDDELIIACDKTGRMLGPIQPQFPAGHAKGSPSSD